MFIFEFFLFLTIIALLVIGMVLSKRNSFNAGFYFFIVMIIQQLYHFISPATYYLQAVIDGKMEPLFGLRIGELIHYLSFIPTIILIIAFVILIIGLFQVWEKRTN